jgi:hypothetical protein
MGAVTCPHPQAVVGLQAHVQDLDIRIINAATGELIRQLTLDPTSDYQPRGVPTGRPKKKPNP